ncbi:MAG: UvrD-helicase domain-containing protein [Oscillospiraceae bacterium]|nr:UvrD-helicase domain-containing protein [Oscillospiraceae bacterium]
MPYIADLHIHSHYSRATSKDCDLPHLHLWARRKGIALLGAGDFTHPAWRAEMAAQLVPAEEGFYTLREELCLPDSTGGEPLSPRFVMSGEISTIYKKNGRVRKVHSVILLPGLEAAELLSKRLEAIGNIHSDGRPILGLDCRDLLEITLEACPEAIFIPAHIWTPHFSLFGAFSGFDTMEECFEDLTPHVHAVETGLSSDPPMNWRVSALDKLHLVSHSDAHSPQKLGREADLIDAPLTYPALKTALETGEGLAGTLEFFPEEGKYHLDGHRACGVCLTPGETLRLGGKCPVCGKKLTIGVQHRVEALADREEGFALPTAKPFESLAPLPEVIAASTGFSPASKKVAEQYFSLLQSLGPEFAILRELPLSQIAGAAGACVAEGIRRLRQGEVRRQAGYDGVFGQVGLLLPEEIEALSGQVSLFGVALPQAVVKKSSVARKKPAAPAPPTAPPAGEALNPEQQAAVTAKEPMVAVTAGPGTGKTKTLVARIAWLVEQGADPGSITAITFTNQAAEELRARLEQRLGGKRGIKDMTIGTFHAVCRRRLGNPALVSHTDALGIAAEVLREAGDKHAPQAFLEQVSRAKTGGDSPLSPELLAHYQEKLGALGLWDFDDLLTGGLSLPFWGKHLFVDEFQDVSPLQYRLALGWGKEGGSLFVIGDPDQAIYGFRGASARCFARLKEDCPGLREIRLAQNYRSTPQVLSCALPVIGENPGGPRALAPTQPEGLPVRLCRAESDRAQAAWIAAEIRRMTGGSDMLESDRHLERATYRSFSDIAVLCRTHRQAQSIEQALRKDSIPCLRLGREDFLESDEVRGVTAFFRWLLSPQEPHPLEQCLGLLWHCPPDLILLARQTCQSLPAPTPEALAARLSDAPPLRPWLERAAEFFPLAAKEPPHRLLARWQGEGDPSPALEKLEHLAVFHDRMESLLDTLLLGEEADLRRGDKKTYASGAVKVMTLHGAKGLEFPAVFLAGVQEGLLPLESQARPTDEEEERRLLFVGLTRAREELILTYAKSLSPFLKGLVRSGALKEEPAFSLPPKLQQMSLF